MTEDQNNKKIIKDVKNTSNEAARLLAGLEESSIEQPSVQESHQETQKHRNPYQAPNRNIEPTSNCAVLVVAAIASNILILFIGLAIGTQKTFKNEESSSSANETNRESIEKRKTTMTPYQRRFYEQALANANDAVLKREHESAIAGLENLKRGNYKDLANIDRALVNNKIIQAKKAITYLDQPGDDKYWEGANYGAQWFDKSPANGFKMFFAYSKKCKSPVVTFGFMSNSKGAIKKRYTLRPNKNLSTLYIPLQLKGRQWIKIEKVKCG